MQAQAAFYPIKITSRSALKKRSRRASWFVIGTSFGIACSVLATTYLSSPAVNVAQIVEPKAEREANLPVAAGVNVVAMAAPVTRVAPSYPKTLSVDIKDGDTLINVLTDTGVSYDEAQHAISSIATAYDVHKLEVGQNIAVVLDQNPKTASLPYISSLTLPMTATSTLELTRTAQTEDADFKVKKIVAALDHKLARASGRIDSSLYETGVSAGLPANLLGKLIETYSYDVDFQREIHPGDSMDVMYERLQTKDGTTAGYGEVVFAELNLSGKILKVYRFADKSGNVDYYNEKGESVKKALLRTPINGARITSGFGMRNHPILGYSKMHRGVDFAAATGTPIYAAGDGTVVFSGVKGGYGNYLRIHHNGQYDSAYGHISRFASGITSGKHVKQGQIVAYVGSTGMATGPHLHYEILAHNEQVNPTGVKFKTGNILAGKEMAAFRKNIEHIQAQLDNTPRKTNLAMAY